MPDKVLKRWEPEDPIEAKRLNDMLRVLQRVDRQASGSNFSGTRNESYSADRQTPNQVFKVVRLTESIGPDTANLYDRTGIVQVWDDATSAWEDTSPADAVKVVTSCNENIYESDDIIVVMSHWQGKYIPLPLITIRTGITVKDAGVYPPETDNPIVYAVRFIHLDFTEDTTINPGDVTQSFLGTPALDTYVLNLNEDIYIPEGTRIWMYKLVDRWYTMYPSGEEVKGTWLCQATPIVRSDSIIADVVEWNYKTNDAERFTFDANPATNVIINTAGWYEITIHIKATVSSVTSIYPLPPITAQGLDDTIQYTDLIANIQEWTAADAIPAFGNVLCGQTQTTFLIVGFDATAACSSECSAMALVQLAVGDKIQVMLSGSLVPVNLSIYISESDMKIIYRGTNVS